MNEDYAAHFTARVIQDALAQAEASYWRHRADIFDQAKPKPDEFHGQRDRIDLSEAWQRCDSVARACRMKAQVIELDRQHQVEAEQRGSLDDEVAMARLMWEQGRRLAVVPIRAGAA